MNRRDFLRPRRLIRAAAPVVGPLAELSAALRPPAPPPADVPLLRFGRQAMATLFEVLLPFGTPDAARAADTAFAVIDRLETQLTVYRDDSEVSLLNRSAAGGPIPVEPGLFGLLRVAAEVHEATGGAFDVTAGPLIRAWGFFRREGRVPPEPDRRAALERVGMRHVDLDPQAGTVRFRRPGVEVNLGSIGKGYALDRAAETLARDHGVRAALLHAGSSSVVGMGSPPGQAGWSIGLRHPWEEGVRLGTVRLNDRSLATSAATHQHFEHAGRRLGHLLDPRTGFPAAGVASATAICTDPAAADALATAFFVGGPALAQAVCRRWSGVGAVILPEEGGEVLAINLSPDDFTPADLPVRRPSPGDEAR
jgi:thiamine biosynthesis lipoprotein